MKTFIFTTIGITSGFVLGYIVGNKVSKKKYQKLADDEISSVKQSLETYYKTNYVKINNDENDDKSKSKPNTKKTDSKSSTNPLIGVDSIDYEALKADQSKYINYANMYKAKKDETVKEAEPMESLVEGSKPYVITPEEFAESEYDFVSLNYYTDGVLADDDYNIIKDINGYVGQDALNDFGRYEADVVYVRNDAHQIDYEILLDERAYRDVAPKGTNGNIYGDD